MVVPSGLVNETCQVANSRDLNFDGDVSQSFVVVR
jgi:hypothetical protein